MEQRPETRNAFTAAQAWGADQIFDEFYRTINGDNESFTESVTEGRKELRTASPSNRIGTILLVSAGMGVYGANNSLVELAKVLVHRAYSVVVLVRRGSAIKPILDSEGIANISASYWPNAIPRNRSSWKIPLDLARTVFGSVNVLLTLLRHRVRPNIVHVNTGILSVGCLLRAVFNCRHLLHLREFVTDDYNLRFPFGFRFHHLIMNRCVDRYIANSDAVKDFFASVGAAERKIVRIHNAVRRNRCEVDRSAFRFPEPPSPVRFLMIGLIHPTKGQLDLLKATNLLMSGDLVRPITVTIVGDGDAAYKQVLEDYCEKHGLESVVHLCGRSDNIIQHLRSSHVGVVCSKREAFGRVTVEYMFAGMPVIASASGGSQEIVQDGVNGALYEVGNPISLAHQMRKFIGDNTTIANFGRRPQEIARTRFDLSVHAERVMAEYQRLWVKRGSR